MKIHLVFPPFWPVTQPYLSTPTLAAYLASKKVSCRQFDLNLQVIESCLNKEYLSKCKNILNSNNKAICDIVDHCIENIDLCLSTVRSKAAFDQQTYQSCITLFSLCFWLISNAYKSETYNYSSSTYQNFKYDPFKSKDLLSCIVDVKNGLINSWLISKMSIFIDEIASDTDLVGISVSGVNQIIPSIMLATLLRIKKPDLKIAMGGSVITRFHEKLNELKPIFEVVDYMLFFEGEEPLYQLVKYLHGELDLNKIENIAYVNVNGKVCLQLNLCNHVDINELPTPMFDREILSRYFAPEPVFPLLSSRGCYWGHCTFCDHAYTFHETHRIRQIDLVINDIKTYIQLYNVRNINFHDDAISPEYILELSNALIAEKLSIKWSCETRLDNTWNNNIFSLAHKAGLTVLFFGLESYVQRILNKMKKGIQQSKIKKILTLSSESGIYNHVFFICGFPTETLEEFKATYEFVKSNTDIIHSWGFSLYSLTKYSPVANKPDAYGIEVLESEQDLCLELPYKSVQYDDNSLKTYYKQIIQEELVLQATKLFSFIPRDHWVILCSDENRKTYNESFIKCGGLCKMTPHNQIFGTHDGYTYMYLVNKQEFIRISLIALDIMTLIKTADCKNDLIMRIIEKYNISNSQAERVLTNFLVQLTKTGLINRCEEKET